MVSHRNYLAITIVMLVVFFLFQFTNVALESRNAYESNSYAVDKEWLQKKSGVYGAGDLEEGNKEGVWDVSRDVIVYIGHKDVPVRKVVNTWSAYSKKQIKSYETLEEYGRLREDDRTDSPQMLVINSGDMDWKNERTAGQLDEYVRSGINLVFSGLPDVSVIKDSRQLKRLFGIKEIKEEETTADGLHLNAGFFLGGETAYQAGNQEEYEERQNMELVFPWYILASGTRTYMRGLYEEQVLEEEDCPAVIWRNRLGRGYVFVINGPYMEDAAGLGILSAVWAQSEDYVIYPVINAQNMIFANYPGLADENREEMTERYGRTMSEMMRYNAWPAVVSVYQKSTMGLTCMLAPQYDYEDDNYPNQSDFLYYMKRLNEQKVEVGLSALSVSDTPLEKKLGEDARLMEETIPGYRFASLYCRDLPDDAIDSALSDKFLETVRTVVTDYSGDAEVVGYQSEQITRQTVISDGYRHTFLEDFRARALETALAYTSVLADMSQAAYPGDTNHTFEKIIYDFGWNTQHYWGVFQGFARTTVSECDDHIRNFLAVDYKETRKNNSIRLDVAGPQMPVWFILRINEGNVSRVIGGSWTKIEDQVYLIEAGEPSVVIQIK